MTEWYIGLCPDCAAVRCAVTITGYEDEAERCMVRWRDAGRPIKRVTAVDFHEHASDCPWVNDESSDD